MTERLCHCEDSRARLAGTKQSRTAAAASDLRASLDPVCNPLIEAHPRRLGARRRPAVRLRAHAKRDLAAVGPVRRLAALRTKGEVIIDAVAKGLFDLGERRALEGDHVAKAGDPARENAVVGLGRSGPGFVGADCSPGHDIRSGYRRLPPPTHPSSSVCTGFTTVDRVKAEIEALRRIGGKGELEWFAWFFDQGAMPWEEEMRQMELFAEHIIPAFR